MTDNPHRILLAEDDPNVRDATAYVLEHAGYAVVAAPTGDAALVHLLGSDDFSLLLTDIRMPGSLDGWALADQAKARHPHLRVIYMTGFDTAASPHPGHGPLLPKPWRPDQLLEWVQRLLGARRGPIG